jgi:hypothetical protein
LVGLSILGSKIQTQSLHFISHSITDQVLQPNNATGEGKFSSIVLKFLGV